jgi:hypothetical protein
MSKNLNQTQQKSDLLTAALVFACLTLLSFLLYQSGLKAPCYYDDFSNITKKSDLTNMAKSLKNIFISRGVAFFTFAVDYHFSGFSVFHFRLTNITIHALTGGLVYLLFRRFYADRYWPGIIAALIFVAHPVQTQAVTYIVQRMTSLSAFFEIACILCYIDARKHLKNNGRVNSPAHLLRYLASIILALLAGLSKENAASVVGLLLAVDFLIVEKGKRFHLSQLLSALPFFLLPILLYYLQYIDQASALHKTRYKVFFEGGVGSNEPQPIFIKPGTVRDQYLFTEFIVVWYYIKLFFLPVSQTLDYGYPLVTKLWNFKSLMGLTAIVATLAASWKIHRKSPLISLGILWYFIAISIESSVFPLDTIYEHRLYLPSIGIILIVIELVFKRLPFRPRVVATFLILLGLATLTYQRNALWADPLAFWADNVAKSPHNFRPKNQLSSALFAQGDLQEALYYAKESAKGYPTAKTLLQVGTLHLALEEYGEAEKHFRTIVNDRPKNAEYKLLYSITLEKLGKDRDALFQARQAADLMPESDKAITQLGLCHFNLGNYYQANIALRRGLTINPNNLQAKQILEKLTTTIKKTQGQQ